MKLRENLYQIEYYKPKYDMNSEELTTLEKKIVHEIGILINKAEKRTKEGLREIKILSMELVEQLKDLIRLYKTNYLVPRFLFENEKTLARIFGKRQYEQLLQDMYKDGRSLLMFKAAQSYLESEYYNVARILFQKVSRLDKSNQLAFFLFMYTSAFYFFFKNRLTKARACAERALAVSGIGEMGFYRKSLNGLVRELSKEAKRASK